MGRGREKNEKKRTVELDCINDNTVVIISGH